MAEIARRLVASGLIDFLSIIGGGAHTYALQAAVVPNMSFTAGLFVPLARLIKEAVPGMPILPRERASSIRGTPSRSLPIGQVDVVGMTRALIADPDLPRKAARGSARRHPDLRGSERRLHRSDLPGQAGHLRPEPGNRA